MPKKDDPRANAEAKARRSRRNQRNVRRRSVSDPQPLRRTTAEIELPEWLPPAVARHARISCKTASDELMLRRLISDLRMRTVWTELLKRKRSNYESSDAFKYPATERIDWELSVRNRLRSAEAISQISNPHAELVAQRIAVGAKLHWAAWTTTTEISELSMQERALVSFFSQAFEFARSESRPVPHVVARRKRAHYLDMANRIRADVTDMNAADNPLLDAALVYEGMADATAPPPGHPLHVQRERRGDERQIAFVLLLVDSSRAIFGQPLYGIVSIVANVAFDCGNWTDARVRKLTKGHRSVARARTD
jgi:hypothetical protein